MKRKLFAFDIDGTLLDTNKQALDSTREALDKLRKAGHLVTIATGRSRFHAQEVIRDLAFTNYILCNGAAGFLDHEQVYKNLLDREQLDNFVKEAQDKNIDTAFVSLDNIKRYSSNHVGMMEEAMHSFGAVLPELDQYFVEEQDIYQALAFLIRITIIIFLVTIRFDLFVGMKKVWMLFHMTVQKQPRFYT